MDSHGPAKSLAVTASVHGRHPGEGIPVTHAEHDRRTDAEQAGRAYAARAVKGAAAVADAPDQDIDAALRHVAKRLE